MSTGLMTANGPLYVRAFGKFVRVVYVASSTPEANAYMLSNPDTALLDTIGPLALIAKTEDLGIPSDPLGDDEFADRAGKAIAAELRLCPGRDGRYVLTNGNKTAAGLTRTVARILDPLGGWHETTTKG